MIEEPEIEPLDEDLQEERPLYLAALRAAQITKVTVYYDGSDDSGAMDRPEFWRGPVEPGNKIDPRSIDVDVDGLIAFFDHILESFYSGWENNDGACGLFTWYIVTDRITLEHRMRVMSYDESSHRF